MSDARCPVFLICTLVLRPGRWPLAMSQAGPGTPLSQNRIWDSCGSVNLSVAQPRCGMVRNSRGSSTKQVALCLDSGQQREREMEASVGTSATRPTDDDDVGSVGCDARRRRRKEALKMQVTFMVS